MKKLVLAIVLLGLVGAGAWYWWSQPAAPANAAVQKKAGPGGAGGPPRSTPVVAAPAAPGDIDVIVNGLGTVTPLRTVTVKSRVEGELVRSIYGVGYRLEL